MKQPHNQTQIIGAKGSGVGALVIYEHAGTYNRRAHTNTRQPLGADYTHTLTCTHHSAQQLYG